MPESETIEVKSAGTRLGSRSKVAALMALVLLVPIPSLGTWLAMDALRGPVGRAIFAAAKLWILLLPVGWLLLVERRRPTIPRPRARGMGAACLTGAVIALAIVAAYWLLGKRWIDPDFVRTKAAEVGLETPTVYLLGCLYWCTINSILEEYVWRWFVFRQLETLLPTWMAAVGAGLFFTAHHIVALDAYFTWQVVLLGSLGVLVGGITWSWLYLRYRNIWVPYVSHVFADVAIFAIGWQLIIR